MVQDDSFTIVVPTRDDPEACRLLLETLGGDCRLPLILLRVVFLANDTTEQATSELMRIIGDERFKALRPSLVVAEGNYPTVEENVRCTLGGNLDAVDDHFLLIGNSDRVDLVSLRRALAYLCLHRLDLLLVGVVNREVYEGTPLRQTYTMPRHVNPRNRLGAGAEFGGDIFSKAMADYGPADALAYLGCQIYTKKFFRDLCGALLELPEPLYSLPLATLELTQREDWAVGFFPEVVATRIDHLEYGANSPAHPPGWWVSRSRTDRGLSDHLFLSIVSNSLHLSLDALMVLLNASMVAAARGKARYHYSNFLFTLIHQMSAQVAHSRTHRNLRYSAGELRDIVEFGRRLAMVDIGLSAEHCAMISCWLQHFSVIGEYSDGAAIDRLLAGAAPVLAMLDARPGMDRWVVEQL